MTERTFEAALLSSEHGEAAASFAGRITDQAAVTFAAVLTDALAADPRRLVINLRRTSWVDTTAVAVLNETARHADAHDIDLVVRDPDDGLRHRLAALEPQLVTIEPG